MSDSDALNSFSSLDELIQVIYQGSSRFVVLSNVDESTWAVHLGLSECESEGRWWRGRWTDKDIRAVSTTASSGVEAYGDALAVAFVQGEMYVDNWSARKGAQIEFVLGTNINVPAHVALVELAPEHAASFATKVFTDIAIQARSRQGRLHPSSFASAGDTGVGTPPGVKPTSSRAAVITPAHSPSERKAEDEIKALKAELARERSRIDISSSSSSSMHKRKAEESRDRNGTGDRTARPVKKERSAQDTSKLHSIAKGNRTTTATAGKGVSLANPSKKARKYQTVEFGSDDD